MPVVGDVNRTVLPDKPLFEYIIHFLVTYITLNHPEIFIDDLELADFSRNTVALERQLLQQCIQHIEFIIDVLEFVHVLNSLTLDLRDAVLVKEPPNREFGIDIHDIIARRIRTNINKLYKRCTSLPLE